MSSCRTNTSVRSRAIAAKAWGSAAPSLTFAVSTRIGMLLAGTSSGPMNSGSSTHSAAEAMITAAAAAHHLRVSSSRSADTTAPAMRYGDNAANIRTAWLRTGMNLAARAAAAISNRTQATPYIAARRKAERRVGGSPGAGAGAACASELGSLANCFRPITSMATTSGGRRPMRWWTCCPSRVA